MVGPKINLSPEEDLYSTLEGGLSKVKRELGTALTLSILLGASLVGVGTGTASLITQHQHYFRLCDV